VRSTALISCSCERADGMVWLPRFSTPARPQARDRMRRQNAFIVRLTLTRCQSRDIRLAHQILTAMPTFHRVVDMACAHDSGMTMLSDGVREIVAP
jgi:hypothetical protein